MKKKLVQGISDFKKFLDNDCYFVDKTHLIAHLIDNPSEVHLITRPRRFGKTLNLSMIRYFFEAPLPGDNGGNGDELPNAPLFEGMSISSHPQCGKYMGQYPVIHISFKDAKETTHENCMVLIKNMLSNEFRRHQYIQSSGLLDEVDQKYFIKILQRKGTDQDCGQSIKYLSAWLVRAYNKPVYILLDEYDTPLHAAYTNGFYDEMIAFIRSFMAQSFKDNPSLKQAVVIGILKVAQESIFSDFNNPSVSTITDPEMEDCFGFTEDEVRQMASHFGLQGEMDSIGKWYNGYVFGNDTVIYNPWSIVNYLKKPSAGLRPYWVNTSSTHLVQKTLQMDKTSSRETVLRLLKGEEVRKRVFTNIAYPRIERNRDVAWSFLLHSGYLKASDRRQGEYHQTYRLAIPNKEVYTAYSDIIITWLEEELRGDDDFLNFVTGVKELEPLRIEESLTRILMVMASYHDMAGKSGEMFYHGLLLGILAYMGDGFLVESNREYGTGRADLTLISRARRGKRAQKVILFELKQAAEDALLAPTAEEALSQALERYSSGIKAKWNPEKNLVLGVAFRGKLVTVVYESSIS